MTLADKMFSRGSSSCPLRRDCTKQANRKYFDSLFADDWEVFVIRRDEKQSTFDWFTLCCELADPTRHAKRNTCATVGC